MCIFLNKEGSDSGFFSRYFSMSSGSVIAPTDVLQQLWNGCQTLKASAETLRTQINAIWKSYVWLDWSLDDRIAFWQLRVDNKTLCRRVRANELEALRQIVGASRQ